MAVTAEVSPIPYYVSRELRRAWSEEESIMAATTNIRPQAHTPVRRINPAVYLVPGILAFLLVGSGMVLWAVGPAPGPPPAPTAVPAVGVIAEPSALPEPSATPEPVASPSPSPSARPV